MRPDYLPSGYGRSFLEFFAPDIPAVEDVALVPDYRLHRDAPTPKDEALRAEIQGWAETQRLNALDLLEILGDELPQLPAKLAASIDEPTETAADRARDAIGFTVQEQVDIPVNDKRLIPDRLRARMSDTGILVLEKSEIKQLRMRGMCLFSEPLPIVVYGNEAPGAQAFTLAHELGHVALQSSGVSGPAVPGCDRQGCRPRRRLVQSIRIRFSGSADKSPMTWPTGWNMRMGRGLATRGGSVKEPSEVLNKTGALSETQSDSGRQNSSLFGYTGLISTTRPSL